MIMTVIVSINVKDNDDIDNYAYYDNDGCNCDDETKNVQFILQI